MRMSDLYHVPALTGYNGEFLFRRYKFEHVYAFFSDVEPALSIKIVPELLATHL